MAFKSIGRGRLPKYAITLVLSGCENRQFWHVCVTTRKTKKWEGDIIEQLGTFDPVPNRFNEKLVALNFDRIRHWLGRDETAVSVGALELFGYCGLLPVHPHTYIKARRMKAFVEEFEKSRQKQLEAGSAAEPPKDADQKVKKEAQIA